MMRPRQLHFLVLAVLLVAAFLFLVSSWDTGHVEDGNPNVGVHLSSEYKAKELEAELAGEVDVNTQKNWRQEVLDGLKSSAKKAKQEHSATSVPKEKSTATHSFTSNSSLLSTTTTTHRPALVTTSPVPLIPHPDPSRITPTYDRAIVIGKLEDENVDWVYHKLPEWQHAVYTIDSPSSGRLHTMINKGHEAMPFLTYVVEHYDKLPSIVVFLKSQRAEFTPTKYSQGYEFDIVHMVRTMNLDFVQQNGFASFRCGENPGCPTAEKPFKDPREGHQFPEKAMPDAFRELFNATTVPDKIRAPCCSQFAVSKEQIRKRDISEYQNYLDWLIRTPLDDDTTGAIFEYLWHVIFGMEPMYCPKAAQCYCNLLRKC